MRAGRITVLAAVFGLAFGLASGLLMPAVGVAGTSAVPLTWSAASFAEKAPFETGTGISGLSCVTGSQCLAVDGLGFVLSSGDPARGASGWHLGQATLPPVRGSGQLSCVRGAPLFCVTLDDGEPWWSASPAGGGPAWHETTVGIALSSIACVSTSFCLGGGKGGLEYSTDPAGGAAAWHQVTIGGGAGTYLVSCAGTSFCAAADTAYGDVATSADPVGGAATWKDADVGGSTPFGSISCPTASLCVTTHGTDGVLTSTKPAGSKWKQVTLSSTVTGITCPSAAECVGVGGPGVVTTTDPAGGASAWHYAAAGVAAGAVLSCPATTLCVLGDADGSIVTSADPTGGAAAWPRPVQVDGSTVITASACPAASLCVAGDALGQILTSADPAAGKWKLARVTPSTVNPDQAGILAVSCPRPSFCVATADGGYVLTSADPAGGATAWHRALADTGGAITSLDCPATTLCVGADSRGDIVTSTDPAGGTPVWKATSVDPGDTIEGISCPSAKLCVGTSEYGKVLTSTDPASGQWQEFTLTEMNLTAPSCPTTSLCLAVTGFGQVVYTKDAAAGLPGWHTVNPGLPDLVRLSCPTVSLCAGFAISSTGADVAVSSTRPLAAGAWAQAAIRVPRQADFHLTSLSCPSASLCLLSDSRGDFFAGT
jgi:hypothetical protein